MRARNATLLLVVATAVALAFAYSARDSDVPLWLGCAAHGLWDALHFGRVGFIPEWYAASCMAADGKPSSPSMRPTLWTHEPDLARALDRRLR